MLEAGGDILQIFKFTDVINFTAFKWQRQNVFFNF